MEYPPSDNHALQCDIDRLVRNRKLSERIGLPVYVIVNHLMRCIYNLNETSRELKET